MNASQEFRINRKVFIATLFAASPFLLIGVGFIILPLLILQYMTTRIVVNDKGVHYRKGWLIVNQKHIPFSKVNTVDVQQGPLARAWDYGTIKLYTGNDIEGIAMPKIDRPQELKGLIEGRL